MTNSSARTAATSKCPTIRLDWCREFGNRTVQLDRPRIKKIAGALRWLRRPDPIARTMQSVKRESYGLGFVLGVGVVGVSDWIRPVAWPAASVAELAAAPVALREPSIVAWVAVFALP